ncbi:MAG: murein biosynthesis integral membrane protein MurJ [Geobacter sp.]
MNDIAKSSLIVSVLSIAGLALGFVSTCVIAAVFGAGRQMDVFFAAITIPTFINSILCSSLSFTFIPVLAEYGATDKKDTDEIISGFLLGSLLVSFLLCLMMIGTAPLLMRKIAPGFTDSEVIQSSNLLRWLLPVIIFTVANELLSSVYYSFSKFLLPSLVKLLIPIFTIFLVLALHPVMETRSIVIAMLAGSMVQSCILFIGLLRMHGASFILRPILNHPGILKIVKLMVPLLLGLTASRALPFIDRHFLSALGQGSIAHVEYGLKLLSAIPPVIVSGIAITLFPVMAKHASLKQWDELILLISKGMRLLFFLSIPFVLLLGPYSCKIVSLVFQRGAFTFADSVAVGSVFGFYLLALPAIAIGTIIGQTHYVLQNTNTVALLSVLQVAIYTSIIALILPWKGYIAIPISYAICFNAFALINAIIVRRRIKSSIVMFPVWSVCSNIFSGLFAFVLLTACISLFSPSPLFVAVFIFVAFILYFLFSRILFRTKESEEILQLLFKTLPFFKKIPAKYLTES